jgi:threonine dehydratase
MNRPDRHHAPDAQHDTFAARRAAAASRPLAPASITGAHIERAAAVLDGVVTRTPVLSSAEVDLSTGAHVFFKCENFQRTGAFKFRGAYHAIIRLDAEQRRAGVIAYSSGNHAHGIALAARMLDVPATVVMPADAPPPKVRAARELGARVIFYDRLRENRETICEVLASETGATVIASSEHPDVIAGQGTVARELFAECGPLDFLSRRSAEAA